MESTTKDGNKAYEPYNDPVPAESVCFITILPVPSTETSMINDEVVALVYAMPTELLHTGAWITIKVEDTDGGYVWALPDSDIELGLDVEPVVNNTATERTTIQTAHLDEHWQSDNTTAPAHYEAEADEVVLTLARENMALSIHGDTLIEPSLAGSTQVGSDSQE